MNNILHAAGRETEDGAESEAGDGKVLTGHSGGDCTEKQSRQRQRDRGVFYLFPEGDTSMQIPH